ncbi:MAG: acyl carrier protein [Halioglobus sp.]
MTDYQEYLNLLQRPGVENKSTWYCPRIPRWWPTSGSAPREVMEFIEKIEDHFDISIPLNILPDVNTIGDLASKVSN